MRARCPFYYGLMFLGSVLLSPVLAGTAFAAQDGFTLPITSSLPDEFADLPPEASARIMLDASDYARLDNQQRIRVIVMFDIPSAFDHSNEISEAAAVETMDQARSNILFRTLGLSNDELSATASNANGPSIVRLFPITPAAAIRLSAEEIAALAADPSVSNIQTDCLSAPFTNLSIPLIGASDLHTGGLTGVGSTIAILDMGVDHEHPMFAGRIIESACFSSNEGVSSISLCPGGVEVDTTTLDAGDDCAYSGDTETAIDGCGHGTHVAGIAAGASFTDPTSGATMIGVAPGANIIAIQVFSRFTGASCTDDGNTSSCASSFKSDQVMALD